MARILVLSGTGRFTDPWHPLPQTSAGIADTLLEAGHDVEVRETTSPDTFRFDDVDLVVVNTGVGADPRNPVDVPGEWDEAYARLGEWVDAGRPVLGVHSAAATFTDWPRWREILGGRWERGVSSHPERSVAVFEAVPEHEHHPIVDDLGLVIVYDERYSNMDLVEDSTPLVHHETLEIFHPCVWVRGRVVYDGLGHDARSYQSESRRDLMRREAAWLLDDSQHR
ncbi:ThuA domain-containing protein [Aestuariimicrobium ganziense]|uniref:ThuA domain-containing protein n=1 Tax=Aestuariimicrobium ganziense TaxID=2773677 RepID=UPI0019417AFB|nr:ThuA domain-containing protein [Aestuariimicrobium ganziense]